MLVTQSCPTLCDSMDYSPPSFSVPGILQARILEWVAMPSSRGTAFKVSSLMRNSRIPELWNFFVGFLRAVTASLPRTLYSTTEAGTRRTNEWRTKCSPLPPGQTDCVRYEQNKSKRISSWPFWEFPSRYFKCLEAFASEKLLPFSLKANMAETKFQLCNQYYLSGLHSRPLQDEHSLFPSIGPLLRPDLLRENTHSHPTCRPQETICSHAVPRDSVLRARLLQMAPNELVCFPTGAT